MSARPRVALAALLAFALLGGPLAAVWTPASPMIATASADQTVENDSNAIPEGTTAINIQLQADGNATWTITTRLAVEDDEDREAFRELAARHESGQRETPWIDEVEAANRAAEASTGRPMAIEGVSRASNATDTTLSVRFTWTNFAREADGEFVVDDAFNASDGTWFDGLTENQVLTVELPPQSTLQSAPRGAVIQQGRVRWDGPQQFDPGYMRIAYTVDGTGGTDVVNPGGNNDALWGGFLVIGALVVGAYVLSQRRDDLPSPNIATGDGTDPPAAAESTDAVAERTATAGTVEPDVETGSDEPGDDIDEALLSDEERVERLLEENGGRMKQANIVKETGWSNAKVSQLLSAMDDDGDIDKLRIGRENLISFPDEDVTELDQD